ncbi:MAG: hypothetical protein GY842_06415 [bacterium]|nr:hypothetical protein [bacterium]
MEEVERLAFGTDMTRELASGGSHSYPLALAPDQFVRVVVDQQGVDVAVDLSAPDGTLVFAVDSPIGRVEAVVVVPVVKVPGDYRLEVRAAEPGAPAGNYRTTVEEPRPANLGGSRPQGEQSLAGRKSSRTRRFFFVSDASGQSRCVYRGRRLARDCKVIIQSIPSGRAVSRWRKFYQGE